MATFRAERSPTRGCLRLERAGEVENQLAGVIVLCAAGFDESEAPVEPAGAGI
jgi:hypothetical protein